MLKRKCYVAQDPEKKTKTKTGCSYGIQILNIAICGRLRLGFFTNIWAQVEGKFI